MAPQLRYRPHPVSTSTCASCAHLGGSVSPSQGCQHGSTTAVESPTTEYGLGKSATEYAIGWISALPIERAAAVVMLEEQYDEPTDFQRNPSDENSYEWGSIGEHCIVIASLPAGNYGTISAVSTAKNMLASLPNLRLGLLVGIGAGIPNSQHDVRLGDVVISQPEGQHGGVVQYDLGKSKVNGEWELKGSLASPPKVVLHTLAALQAKHELRKPLFVQILNNAIEDNILWGSRYARPNQAEDRLFEANTPHKDGDCINCGIQIKRKPRQSTDPELHYGTIASGDTLVKDAKARDEIVKRAGSSCICLDMEAAGLIDSFPCLVIRGICDYADAHKNDIWQRYASATAAAFAKELLYYLPAVRINKIERAVDLMDEISRRNKEAASMKQKIEELIRSLYACPYAERKDRNYKAAQGTCRWFLKHPFYRSWQDGGNFSSGLLWVSADAGCGKSVLARHLIDNVLPHSDGTIIYWFFKDDFLDQKSLTGALRGLIHQLFVKHPHLISHMDIETFANKGPRWDDASDLWDIFQRTMSHPEIGKIFCVIDALDECDDSDRQRLIQWVVSVFSDIECDHQMKMILTSRHYGSISDGFYDLESKFPNIHLDGDNEAESEEIAHEIGLVIHQRVKNLSEIKNWSPDVQEFLLQKLLSTSNRTYLWVHLTMEYIASTFYTTKAQLQQAIATLPSTIDEAYNKILNRSIDLQQSKIVLGLIVAATRPLSLYEMSQLLALGLNRENHLEIEEAESELNCKTNIRNLCGLFVIVRDSQIFLLHQTAREFLVHRVEALKSAVFMASHKRQEVSESTLTWKHCILETWSNRVIAERCLRFLIIHDTNRPQLNVALSDEPTGTQSLDESEKYMEFWRYCIRHWIFHFTMADFDKTDVSTEHALSCLTPKSDDSGGRHESMHEIYDCLRGQAHESHALLSATILGLMPVVELSLERGVQMEIWKSHALWWATYKRHRSIAFLLLKHHANPNFDRQKNRHFVSATTLHHAICAEDAELVNALCSHGAKVDDWELQCAVGMYHNESVIRHLINHGARVSCKTEEGESILTLFQYHSKGRCSSYNYSSAIFDLLWDGRKSCLEQQDLSGNRALHHAAISGCVECVRFLLGQQVLIDARNNIGETPLMAAAAYSRQSSMIELLLQFGADINAVNSTGNTPLMIAIVLEVGWADDTTIIKKLLEHGSRIDIRNRVGDTAIHLATRAGRYDVIEALLAYGADINAKDAHGNTALFRASRMLSVKGLSSTEGRLEKCIKVLLTHKADGYIKYKEDYELLVS